MSPTTATFSRLFLVGALAIALGACAAQPKPQGSDYRQNHKIQVDREQVSITVALADDGTALAPADARRFQRFLRDYVQRGRTVVTVESARPQDARAVLLGLGLRARELAMAASTTVQPPNVVLSFSANKVVSPECGDWSSPPSFTADGKPHSNFGCASQRNISKMVADPGDFIQAQPSDGGNASRSDAAIFSQQSGAPKTRLLDGTDATITGN